MTDNNDSYKTRQSLLNRITDPRDEKSWNEFLVFYQPIIRNILNYFKLTDVEKEDLSQDIVLKLWKLLPDEPYDKKKGRFRDWLSTVIRNEARQFLRTTIRRKELIADDETYLSEELHGEADESAINEFVKKEWDEYVFTLAWDKVKTDLNEVSREIFLKSLGGIDVEKIAVECGIKKNMVYMYRKRVKDLVTIEISRVNEQFEF